MKNILLAVLFLVVLPVLMVGQTSGNTGNRQKGSDEQAVRQMINDLIAALSRNDVSALDRIYADSYTFTSDAGVMTTKAERLAALKSGDLKYESISFDDVSIRMYGNAAVATFRVMSKLASNGQNINGKFRTTATFVKLNGRWQEVAAQSTPAGGE